MIEMKGVSVKGNFRAQNEDTIIMHQNGDACFAGVLDGMGGLSDGKLASLMAARRISRSLNEALNVSGANGEGITTIIRQAFYAANSELFECSLNRRMRMGTTASIVVYRDKKIFFGHVGDTRLFHITCDSDITQLSTDHRHGNCKNVLTNAIGIFPELEVETGLVEMIPGESLLLSSDGLHDFFSQAQMKQAVAERSSLSEKLHFMIRKALQDGSKDNVSGILLKLTEQDE